MRHLLILASIIWAAAATAADVGAANTPRVGSFATHDGGRTRRFIPTISNTYMFDWLRWKYTITRTQSVGQKQAGNSSTPLVLEYKKAASYKKVQDGRKLRILLLGDSITVGFLSDENYGDGDGYRRELKKKLSKNTVVFAGNVKSGTMKGGYYAAWSGQTIQFISEHADEALSQRPNLVLLMAGTNDMNPNDAVSKQGHDPHEATARLGKLVDKVLLACPDATVIVAIIPGTCDSEQMQNTAPFQKLIPDMVRVRRESGQRVLVGDFSSFGMDLLRDCIHPTNEGYRVMGDYWYDFIQQVPEDWIQEPVGDDPMRAAARSGRTSLSVLLLLVAILTTREHGVRMQVSTLAFIAALGVNVNMVAATNEVGSRCTYMGGKVGFYSCSEAGSQVIYCKPETGRFTLSTTCGAEKCCRGDPYGETTHCTC